MPVTAPGVCPLWQRRRVRVHQPVHHRRELERQRPVYLARRSCVVAVLGRRPGRIGQSGLPLCRRLVLELGRRPKERAVRVVVDAREEKLWPLEVLLLQRNVDLPNDRKRVRKGSVEAPLDETTWPRVAHRVEANVSTRQAAILAPVGPQASEHSARDDVGELQRFRRELAVKERIAERDRPDAREGRAERRANRARRKREGGRGVSAVVGPADDEVDLARVEVVKADV